jgi:N-methylhydantoinase B
MIETQETSSTAVATNIDPITLELVQERTIALVSEMRAYLSRTAYSVNIHEAQDFSCALLDRTGQLVAKGPQDHVLHIIPVSTATRLVIERFAGRIAPGDVFLHNDPYSGGTHLNDIAFIRPVFVNGEIAFFVCVRAHWEDVGGMSPGSLSGNATEIYQEGVRIPPIKMVDQGTVAEAAFELLMANVRMPDKSQGDFRAMMGTCELGEQKLGEMMAKYGSDTVLACAGRLIQRSELRMRQAIAAIPDSRHEYEFHLENGGGSPKPVRARVALIVSGDEITVDFEGSSPTVQGPINTGPSMAPMMAFACLKSLLDPTGAINAGAMAPIRVLLPKGSYLNAERPAACSGMAEATYSVATTLLGALAAMLPDRAVGDLKGAGNNFYIGGTHPDTRTPFLLYEFAAGGSGAVRGVDGNNGCRTFLEGDFGSIQPVEVAENECPLLVERSELRVDTGGPGQSRGGLGIDRRIQVLADDAALSYIGDKIRIPPFGVLGGESSGANAFGVIRDGHEFDPAPMPGKVTGYRLKSGDITFSRSAGGGGYGDPLDRDPKQVLLDVAYGYVSERGARDDYGVILRRIGTAHLPLPEHWQVDEAATQVLRLKLLGERDELTLVEATERTSIDGRHVCFAAAATIAALDVAVGDPIEILNPAGAPLRLWIEEGQVPMHSIGLDEASLRVLKAVPGETRRARRLRQVNAQP